VTPEEHGWFRAVALGLHNREILCVTPEGRVFLKRALALALSYTEVLIRDSEEHASFRALALGLFKREVLIVTLRRTFRLGWQPSDCQIRRS
jgi:hypothetical protein